MITRAPVAIAVAAILACNQGLEPALAPTSCPNGFVGVCGTVSFAGQLPESTAKVFIVAFDTFPKSQNDLFKFKPQPSPPTLPLGGPPCPYPEGALVKGSGAEVYVVQYRQLRLVLSLDAFNACAYQGSEIKIIPDAALGALSLGPSLGGAPCP